MFNIQWKGNSGWKGQSIFFLFQSAEIIILKEVKILGWADTYQHDQFCGIITQHPSHKDISETISTVTCLSICHIAMKLLIIFLQWIFIMHRYEQYLKCLVSILQKLENSVSLENSPSHFLIINWDYVFSWNFNNSIAEGHASHGLSLIVAIWTLGGARGVLTPTIPFCEGQTYLEFFFIQRFSLRNGQITYPYSAHYCENGN